MEQVAKHSSLIKYSTYQASPGSWIADVRSADLGWQDLLRVRSLCKLRAGTLVLAGRGGKYRRARLQECLFCDEIVENPLLHALAFCKSWSPSRMSFARLEDIELNSAHNDFAIRILGCGPHRPGFCTVLRWADELDKRSHDLLDYS